MDAEPERFHSLLFQKLEGVCPLTENQAALLFQHYLLLDRWNRVLNLSSIRNMETAIVRHYCESVFLAANLPPGSFSVGDLGSGAGFPGIPLAVVRPECQVTLIESHQRKAVFLREATRDYPNVQVICARAEKIPEKFDWLVSRAVAWREVLSVVPGLAQNVALLLGAGDAEELFQSQPSAWHSPLSLPWAGQQRLIFGSNVPRGT